MRPFQLLNGTHTLDEIKAALQLDPSDAEKEQKIRMALENDTADQLEKSMRLWLRDVIPNASDVELGQIERNLKDGSWRVRDVLNRSLRASADLGVSVAIDQFETIGFGFDWTLAHQAAADWAGDETGRLITQITETTRKRVATATSEWIENGEPLNALVKDLEPIFGRQRAELIASTEVTKGYAEGSLISYQESGVVENVEWRTSNDERVCPICGPLGGLLNDDGTQTPQPLGGQRGSTAALRNPTFTHPNGGEYGPPPAHPRCRCWIVPVVDEV